MATGGEIIDTVLERLEESTSSPVFWTRAELFTHLNDGFQELNLMILKNQVEAPFGPTTDTFQTTPDGKIAILHISQNSLFLRKKTLEAMDREYQQKWEPRTTATAAGMKEWGPVGLNKFFISPKLSGTGPEVTLVTLDLPATIGEATTIPLDEEYVEALEEYVFHMARFKEGGAEFQQSLDGYQEFRERAGFAETRRLSEQFLAWSKEPNADTGPRYSTLTRS